MMDQVEPHVTPHLGGVARSKLKGGINCLNMITHNAPHHIRAAARAQAASNPESGPVILQKSNVTMPAAKIISVHGRKTTLSPLVAKPIPIDGYQSSSPASTESAVTNRSKFSCKSCLKDVLVKEHISSTAATVKTPLADGVALIRQLPPHLRAAGYTLETYKPTSPSSAPIASSITFPVIPTYAQTHQGGWRTYQYPVKVNSVDNHGAILSSQPISPPSKALPSVIEPSDPHEVSGLPRRPYLSGTSLGCKPKLTQCPTNEEFEPQLPQSETIAPVSPCSPCAAADTWDPIALHEPVATSEVLSWPATPIAKELSVIRHPMFLTAAMTRSGLVTDMSATMKCLEMTPELSFDGSASFSSRNVPGPSALLISSALPDPDTSELSHKALPCMDTDKEYTSTAITKVFAISVAKQKRQAFSNGKFKPKRAREDRTTVWLTKEERESMQALTPSEDVNVLNNGWGEQAETDWNNSGLLHDWAGNLLPAPVEWAGRHQCKRDNWAESILEYIDNSSLYYVQTDGGARSTCIIDTSTEIFATADNTEIAPTDWIPQKIENQPLQTFWTHSMKSTIKPVDAEDSEGDPFWLLYSATAPYLKHRQHVLTIARTVPDDNAHNMEHKLWCKCKAQTSATAITERERKVKRGQRKRRKQEKAVRQERLEDEANEIAEPLNPLRAQADIYVRPIDTNRDVNQIQEIMAHYITETCFVSELKAPSTEEMLTQLRAINDAGLPIIVAVLNHHDKGKRSGSRNGFSVLQAPQKVIVGFAFADEIAGIEDAMSYTALLKIFVHQTYIATGVGKNLLDRMLYLLDPGHNCSNAVPWHVPQSDASTRYHTPGGKRVVGTIRIPVHYASDDRARLVWIEEWLSRFGFEKQADFGDAGIKMKKWTRNAIFQAKTGSDVNPAVEVKPIF